VGKVSRYDNGYLRFGNRVTVSYTICIWRRSTAANFNSFQ